MTVSHSKGAAVTPIPKTKKRKTTKKQSLSKQCDILAGQIVRARGYCQVGTALNGKPCGGSLQWSHGFSRSYRAVRWDQRNGFCVCRDHHAYTTYHDLEWKDWMRRELGEELFDELWALALTHQPPDLKVLVLQLKIQAAEAA